MFIIHCPDGGTGRHAGLKILCSRERAGSIPAPGTIILLKAPVYGAFFFLGTQISTQIYVQN